MPTTLTPFERFLEQCSVPELTWYIDSISDYFISLANYSAASTVSLSNYVDGRSSQAAPSHSNITIPATQLDEAAHLPQNIGIDVETRRIGFPPASAGNDSSPLSSPLAALSSYLACVLAAALWDKSIVNPKQARVRFINNCFILIDGIYENVTRQWVKAGKQDWIYAVGVIELAKLKELQTELDTAPKIAHAPESGKLDGWPLGFLPIDTSAVQGVAATPSCEVTSRPPLTSTKFKQHNRTNGVVIDTDANGHDSEEATQKTPQASTNENVTVVIPSAGRSSRFPGVKPKWMLTQPSGALMVVDCLGGLDLTQVNHIVVGLLKEHVDTHCGGDVNAILIAFKDGVPALNNMTITIVVISAETIDQIQTVECILNAAKITGPIFLKDCDNQFTCPVRALDGVATLDITRATESGVSNTASKSYVAYHPSTRVMFSIVEKRIISNAFGIGGYAFLSAADFQARVGTARIYQALTGATSDFGVELAVSDIVWLKMMDRHNTSQPFVSIEASNYEDWGTLTAWRGYCNTFKTLFVDVDGTLVRNSGQYFMPTWGTTEPLTRNVEHLNMLHATGRVRTILVTSRLERFRETTELQLRKIGVKYDQILFGMLHAGRVVVNDYAATNPYPAAGAINLKRNAEDLPETLQM